MAVDPPLTGLEPRTVPSFVLRALLKSVAVDVMESDNGLSKCVVSIVLLGPRGLMDVFELSKIIDES